MSHLWVSSCTFLRACRVWMYQVPSDIPSFGSLGGVLASVADTYHPHRRVLQWGVWLLLIWVLTDPACYCFAVCPSCPFSGLRKSLVVPVPSPSPLNLYLEMYQKLLPECGREKVLGPLVSRVSDENWCITVLRDAAAQSQRCYLCLDVDCVSIVCVVPRTVS